MGNREQKVGRRVPDGEWFNEEREPGDYGKVIINGAVHWFNWPPGAPYSGLLKRFDPEHPEEPFHEVEEHPEGSITVHPSILMQGRVNEMQAAGGPIIDSFSGWHGFLERGIWRTAA